MLHPLLPLPALSPHCCIIVPCCADRKHHVMCIFYTRQTAHWRWRLRARGLIFCGQIKSRIQYYWMTSRKIIKHVWSKPWLKFTLLQGVYISRRAFCEVFFLYAFRMYNNNKITTWNQTTRLYLTFARNVVRNVFKVRHPLLVLFWRFQQEIAILYVVT